jgi:NAD(P)H-dependent FMN reductase
MDLTLNQPMKRIGIISASVRKNRKSHRVALFFKNYIEENKLAEADIIDLNEYQFPVFNERLKFQDKSDKLVLEFAQRIKASDGLIIVTPEYNGGYPASLKNVLDLLYDEWKRKPIGISTVSDGPFGGNQVLISLQFTLWKMKAWTVPALFPVPNVEEAFDASGNCVDKDKTNKRANPFIIELMWSMEAVQRMNL